MAKKLSRQQLKRDEVLETFEKGFGYLSTHRKGSLQVAIGVACAILIAALIVVVKSHRETSAREHLSRALSVLATPLASEVPPGQAPDKTFSSEAERRAEADRDLLVAASLPGTRAGRQAQALLAAERPEEATSLETFKNLAKRTGLGAVAAVAEIDALRSLSDRGKTSEAIARARTDIEASETAAPKDALLFELARLYESSGSAADARLTYERLVRDYPGSPYAAESQTKGGSL